MRSLKLLQITTALTLAVFLAACGGGGGGETDDTVAPVTSADPAGGNYDEAISVSLTCSDGNGSGCMATFYTTDGSDPDQSSSVYSSPLDISTDTELKFFSVDNAGNQETIRSESYTIGGVADTTPPSTTADPAGGDYASAQNVTLTCDDGAGSGCAATYYTTDGSDPDTSSAVYSSAIAIDSDTELKFFSVDNAGNQEAVNTESYTIGGAADTTPPTTTADPAGGNYDTFQNVTLTCDDGAGSGCAATYYTTDGTEPDTDSNLYSSPIYLDADTELKFFSVDNADNFEAVKTESYVISGVADEDPPLTSASPVGGSYVDAQTVTLSCDDGAGSGCAATYYTTDGSDPDTGSAVYDSPLQIAEDTTLKFFSVDNAGNQETIRSEVYQVVGQCQPGVDTDGDGLNDCEELEGWYMDLELNGDGQIAGPNEVDVHVTSDPLQADADGDGLEDPEELNKRINPNRADTDQDGLDDYEELHVYFSSPKDVDHDDDATGPDHAHQPSPALFDGSEVMDHHTSPTMADTDGDDYTDYEEIEVAGRPLVADLPLIEVDIISNLGVFLDAKIESGCEISGETMQANFSRDVARSKRKSESNSEYTFDSSADMHAEADAGFGDSIFPHASASVDANASVSMSTSRESNTSFEKSSVRENTRNFRRYQSQNCFDNQAADAGLLTATIKISNAGNRTVYLQNLEIGARRRDPANPGEFYSLASTTLYPTENDIGGGSSEEHEVSIEVSASTAMDLLSDPTGLFFSVNDFEISDEDGRNFAFIEQTTLNQTGMLEIDYGDGRVERYLIATNVERDALNNPVGVNLAWAMEEVLGLDFATELNGDGISVLAWIDNETDYKYDDAELKYWFVLGSSDSLDVPDFDFEDIVLKKGDFISLTLMRDRDGDGLFDREEDYYGTDPLAADTDRDMFEDRLEADSDLRHPVVPEFPAGKRVRQVVSVVPENHPTDVRTKVLLENGTVWTLDGVPVQMDTDLEFASLAGGGKDRYGFTWFGVTTDGDLYAWGSNKFGKLGIEEAQPITADEPVLVGPACGCWRKVVTSELHVLAIKTDGSLWAWGYGSAGQLGVPEADHAQYCPFPDDSYPDVCARAPVMVDAGPWLDIAAGRNYSLGIKEDNTLWAWGGNQYGQLGTGDDTNRELPTRIYDAEYDQLGYDTWKTVSAWGGVSLAVLEFAGQDEIRTWGLQNFTQYGYCDGDGTGCGAAPDFVYRTDATNLGVSCATDDDCGDGAGCLNIGVWRCCTFNYYIMEPRYLPAPNAPDDPIVSISAGPFMAATWGHIVTSGTWPFLLYHWAPTHSATWGYNHHGETGRGPGGSSVCYRSNNFGHSPSTTPLDCHRALDEVVDDDTNPFLLIERGRGIGAPPQDGVSDDPPPVQGELNVWGANDTGQLGLGYGTPGQISEPELVPEFPLP